MVDGAAIVTANRKHFDVMIQGNVPGKPIGGGIDTAEDFVIADPHDHGIGSARSG